MSVSLFLRMKDGTSIVAESKIRDDTREPVVGDVFEVFERRGAGKPWRGVVRCIGRSMVAPVAYALDVEFVRVSCRWFRFQGHWLRWRKHPTHRRPVRRFGANPGRSAPLPRPTDRRSRSISKSA